MDNNQIVPDPREAILHLICQKPPLAIREIILMAGAPSFTVRAVVSDLFRQREIERTGCAKGIGRYCPAGRKDSLVRIHMKATEILAKRRKFATAIHTLQRLQHAFLLSPDAQERCNTLLEAITLRALMDIYRGRRARNARLYHLAKWFGLSSCEARPHCWPPAFWSAVRAVFLSLYRNSLST